MESLRKWFRSYNKKEPDAEESDVLTNQTAEYANDIGDKQAEDPNFKRLMEDPIEALKNNEKLRNAVLKKQKEMGLNILDLNIEPSEDAHTTDISKIELNSKIHIAMNNNNGRVNLLLIGKSGCGQTSFISYLTRDHELEGDDTMFAQRFNGVTFDLQIQGGNANVRVHESPGMCSGFDVPQLGEHWNKLIATMNGQSGVSIFLLLIKSNERVTAQFIDELEEFSQLYFGDKQMFWERTVVIFTAIDQLTECDTFQDRVDKVSKQVNKLEKLKRVIDLTGKHCLYVSCFDEADKQRIVNDLTNMIVSMLPYCLGHTKKIDDLEPVNKKNESILETSPIVVTKPAHIIHNDVSKNLEVESSKVDPLSKFDPSNSMMESDDENQNNNSVLQSIYIPNQHDFDFLSHLNRADLISLFKEMCDDKKTYVKLQGKASSLEKELQHGNSKSKKSNKKKKADRKK